MTTALVLAGTRPGGDPLAQEMGLEHKALIEIGGVPLLASILVALRDAGADRVVVSCNAEPVADLARELGAEVIAAEAGPSASVMAAFDTFGAPMIVTTSDHALLQPDWAQELVTRTPADADHSVRMAERGTGESAVPETTRTYWRFADGQWSGCNLFYLKTPAARRAIETWSMVESHRKQPWRIAAKLGIGTLVAMALGRLTLAEGLARLGKRIGITTALVPASDGLAAVDVDKRDDLDLVKRLAAKGV